jgi:hypothetical protein
MLTTFCSAAGFSLLTCGLVYSIPELLFGAFGAMGLSTAMNLPIFSIANAFPGREGMVLSLLNGAFDASSSVFLVMSVTVASTSAALSTVSLVYLVGPVAALLLTSLLLWRDQPFQKGIESRTDDSYIALTELKINLHSEPRSEQLAEVSANEDFPATETAAGFNHRDSEAPFVAVGFDYSHLQAMPFSQQARTREFWFYIVFHVIAILHVYFFLGTERCASLHGMR